MAEEIEQTPETAKITSNSKPSKTALEILAPAIPWISMTLTWGIVSVIRAKISSNTAIEKTRIQSRCEPLGYGEL